MRWAMMVPAINPGSASNDNENPGNNNGDCHLLWLGCGDMKWIANCGSGETLTAWNNERSCSPSPRSYTVGTQSMNKKGLNSQLIIMQIGLTGNTMNNKTIRLALSLEPRRMHSLCVAIEKPVWLSGLACCSRIRAVA